MVRRDHEAVTRDIMASHDQQPQRTRDDQSEAKRTSQHTLPKNAFLQHYESSYEYVFSREYESKTFSFSRDQLLHTCTHIQPAAILIGIC